MHIPPPYRDLHAWADDQLGDERRRAFERAMARDHRLGDRACAIREQNDWLRKGLAPVLHETIPARILDAAQRLNAHLAREHCAAGERSGEAAMDGRILPFDPSAHHRADRLLPWFVNGTLARDDLDFVVRHLADCTACQHEVEWLRALGAACADARMHGDALVAAQSRPSEPRRDRSRTTRAMSRWRAAWADTAGWTRWAMAAQLCALVVLGAALVTHMTGTPAEYRTLGSPAADSVRASIVVVFEPHTTEAEMRRILRIVDARVVGGPTQADGYLLALPEDRVAASLATLQSQRAVVLAAPLGPVQPRR